MVLGEFKEILFWQDIPRLLENERKIREKYKPDESLEGRILYSRESERFILDSIPTKEEFLARIEYYSQNGRPQWITGRNPYCDDLSLVQLKKANGNQFRGKERAKELVRGISIWADHIGFYVEKALSLGQNNILELTIGAGFGTAAVVEMMSEDDFFVGVDIDLKCAKTAEGILRHYGKSGIALATSLWNLPFDEETFSVVCSHLGIDECREVPTILKEAARVLMPRGRLVITCRDSGYERTHSYFELYGIGKCEAAECLRRARHYTDKAQIDQITAGMNMTLTDYRQFRGRYVAVYEKDT